jgi:DNA repair photolyase
MGGKVCGVTLDGTPWLPEPKVPSLQDSCGFLEQIVRLLGHPARIAIRIDPIAKFVMHDGSEYSNRSELDGIIRHTTAFGIKKFVFSLLEPLVYKKVVRRFKELGIEIQAYTLAERIQLQTELSELEQMYNCTISACCVEDLPASSCVSGQELTLLHPGGLGVSLKMPRTRARCGCTQSIDIGGWPPKPCHAGCDYCYARPVYSKKSSSPM